MTGIRSLLLTAQGPSPAFDRLASRAASAAPSAARSDPHFRPGQCRKLLYASALAALLLPRHTLTTIDLPPFVRERLLGSGGRRSSSTLMRTRSVTAPSQGR